MTHSCIVRRCRKPFHGTSKGIGADEGEIGFDDRKSSSVLSIFNPWFLQASVRLFRLNCHRHDNTGVHCRGVALAVERSSTRAICSGGNRASKRESVTRQPQLGIRLAADCHS